MVRGGGRAVVDGVIHEVDEALRRLVRDEALRGSDLIGYDAVSPGLLGGTLAELALPVPMTVALPPPEDRSFADVWSALGGGLKPSLDVVVSAWRAVSGRTSPTSGCTPGRRRTSPRSP